MAPGGRLDASPHPRTRRAGFSSAGKSHVNQIAFASFHRKARHARHPAEGLRNFWYATLPTDALKEGPKPFRLLDQPVVLFLDERASRPRSRTAACHRTAKLSKGWIKDGHIVCGYHGWEYDRTGKLVNIPQFPFEQAVPARGRNPFSPGSATAMSGSASASRFSTFRMCRRTATPPSAASTSSTTSGAARP